MISQERVRPTDGALAKRGVSPPGRRHLDLRLASLTVGPLPQVGEVMNHAWTALVQLIMTFRQDLIKQILGAFITHRERIFVPEKRDVVSNHALMTIAARVDQDGTVAVPQEAALVVFHKSSQG